MRSRENSLIPTQDTNAYYSNKKDKQTVSTRPEFSVSEELCEPLVEESSSQCCVNSLTSFNAKDSSNHSILQAKSMGSFGPGALSHPQNTLPELTRQETRSLVLSNKSQDSASQQDDFLSSLVTPHHSQTKEGKGMFVNLYLPPLPHPDASQNVPGAALQSKTPIPLYAASNSSTVNNRMDTLGSLLEEEPTPSNSGQETKTSEVTLSVSELAPKQKPSSSPRHLPTNAHSRKKLYGQDTLNKLKRVSSKGLELSSKEKSLQAPREKYCPTGTCTCYLMHVQSISYDCAYVVLCRDIHNNHN